jgi:hypothetical protein
MLLALETLGLLTSEQTAAWSRRFELAVLPHDLVNA